MNGALSSSDLIYNPAVASSSSKSASMAGWPRKAASMAFILLVISRCIPARFDHQRAAVVAIVTAMAHDAAGGEQIEDARGALVVVTVHEKIQSSDAAFLISGSDPISSSTIFSVFTMAVT
jgi:hypothetical protein